MIAHFCHWLGRPPKPGRATVRESTRVVSSVIKSLEELPGSVVIELVIALLILADKVIPLDLLAELNGLGLRTTRMRLSANRVRDTRPIK